MKALPRASRWTNPSLIKRTKILLIERIACSLVAYLLASSFSTISVGVCQSAFERASKICLCFEGRFFIWSSLGGFGEKVTAGGSKAIGSGGAIFVSSIFAASIWSQFFSVASETK